MTGDAMRDVIARMMWPRCMETVGGFCGEGCVCEKEAKDFADDLLAAPASARLALARAITPDTHAVVETAMLARFEQVLSEAVWEFYDSAHSSGDPDDPTNMTGDAMSYRDCKEARAMIAAARGADAEGGK